MNDISIVTYTNSNCKDVWPMYFGQLKKYLPNIKSYIISDENPNISESFFIKYNNSEPYYVHWLNALKYIKEEFIIYSQEDFILYDFVNQQMIKSSVDFIKKEGYSYVRPIRCGFDSRLLKIKECYYNADKNTDDIFQMQITLWKKHDFFLVYEKTKSEKWYENSKWREVCRNNGINGSFMYNNEKKRGSYHYDSSIYPYMCTAISKGKWNMNEYGEQLEKMFKEYNVDYKKRGLRLDYGVYT
jgi:hypothetical protein